MISSQYLPIIVTVAIFVMSTVLAWLGFLLRRFVSKHDRLQEAIFYPEGPIATLKTEVSGIHQALGTYAKSDSLGRTEERLAASIDAVGKEGVAREGRLLRAVEDSIKANRADNDGVRKEVTGVNQRIDMLLMEMARKDA